MPVTLPIADLLREVAGELKASCVALVVERPDEGASSWGTTTGGIELALLAW